MKLGGKHIKSKVHKDRFFKTDPENKVTGAERISLDAVQRVQS